MDTNIYLHFDGNCEEAFKFYEKNLGWEDTGRLPLQGQSHGRPDACRIQRQSHASRMTMATRSSWVGRGRWTLLQPGGFSINIDSKDVAEAERVFNAMSEGGQVHMPFAETFWAKRFGMFIDKFGIPLDGERREADVVGDRPYRPRVPILVRQFSDGVDRHGPPPASF